ncbi:MAG: hypothetical protein O3A96_11775 [Proteobacteria bacterium]|nr:hypothetical protein [Pseudomonadota bacterium]
MGIDDMTFGEAIAQWPDHLLLWIMWLLTVMVAAPLVLLAFREARRAGFVLLATNLLLAVVMHYFYKQVGFVRLLGLPHIVIWTPLLIYCIRRLRRGGLRDFPRGALLVFSLTLTVSLVFDYIDTARYLLGETALMVPATSQ